MTQRQQPPPAATQNTDLPSEIPLFPLNGVLLLPRGELPLHIFEPRYIAMIDAALRGDRIIGMIQPRQNTRGLTETTPDAETHDAETVGDEAPLFNVGCAGRITSFSETADHRYYVTLTGLSRFRLLAELPLRDGFRRARVCGADFRKDAEPAGCLDLDRVTLKQLLGAYFEQQNINCDWAYVDGATDETLVTCLSMICPFDAAEKQALLEAGCCRARAVKFMAMLEMAVKGGDWGQDCCGGHCH